MYFQQDSATSPLPNNPIQLQTEKLNVWSIEKQFIINSKNKDDTTNAWINQ